MQVSRSQLPSMHRDVHPHSSACLCLCLTSADRLFVVVGHDAACESRDHTRLTHHSITDDDHLQRH